MPITIEGWVEVSSDKASLPDNAKNWSGLISLLPLIHGCDEGSSSLFGISKSTSSGVASDRGIPANASLEVKKEIQGINEFEIREGVSEHFGFTYIYYNEIEEIIIKTLRDDIAESQWNKVINLIDTLIPKTFDSKQIRIIVWACI